MLSGRYIHLHEALGLGPMWLKRGAAAVRPDTAAMPAAPTVPQTAAAPSDGFQVARSDTQPPARRIADSLHTPDRNGRTDTDKTPSDKKTAAATHPEQLWPQRPLPREEWQDQAVLAQSVGSCTACTLHRERRQALCSSSGRQAALLVVSPSPAARDDDQGILFSGSHGRLLSNMLAAIDVGEEEVHFSSWLRCAPRLSLTPDIGQQTACAAFLEQEIRNIRPQALLLLGESFAEAEKQWMLDRIAPDLPRFIIPHPAAILRTPILKARVWQTLRALRQTLAAPFR